MAVRKHARVAVLGGLCLSLALTACSTNTGDGSGSGTNEGTQGSLDIIGTAEDAKGPAAPVEGAQTGGTLKYVGLTDFTHLDPARTYVGTYMMMQSGLLGRTLTGYKEIGDNSIKLVGDLATDSGTDVDGDCK